MVYWHFCLLTGGRDISKSLVGPPIQTETLNATQPTQQGINHYGDISLAVSTMNNEKVKEYMLSQITPTPTQFSASSQYGLVESTSSHSTSNTLPELTVKSHIGSCLELGSYRFMKFLSEVKDAAQMSSLLQLSAVVIWYNHFCAK